MEVSYSLEKLSSASFLPLYLSIALLSLLTLVLAKYLSHKPRASFFLGGTSNLPPGSLGFPFIGESISFFRALKKDRIVEWVASRNLKHGPVFKTSLMGSKVVVITGQQGNKFIFSGADNGLASNLPVCAAKILGRQGIFEVTGSRHKLVRGALMSFLKPETLQRFVSQMDSIVQQQIFQELDGKESIQAVALMKRITFKVTCSLLFGIPEGKEKVELLQDFTTAVKGTWAMPLEFPGTPYHRAIQARNRISKKFSDLINRRKIEMEQSREESQTPKDIISTFVALRDENGQPLPDEEIIDNLVTLVFASHDTITILLGLLVRHLARDSKVLNQVIKEQKEVVKAREGTNDEIQLLGWSEVQMMKYTWRVAQELMRFTAPIFGNFKLATRDTSFGGFDIPKGWQVFWASSPTQMDKNVFEDPEKFDPSRFDKAVPPYTYIPFAAGPRICPGAEFARIEVLLIIHHLVTNYHWEEMIPNEPLTREPLPYPSMGLPIKLQPRECI